jgi:membrane fusion protein (multidrug efflux system)
MNPITIKRFALYGVLCASLALGACKPGGPGGDDPDKKDGAEEVSVPVEVGLAERRPMQANYTGPASLEAEREADVVAKTSGVLLRLMVEEGDRVREGQVLAQLDPERPRLELARAEANLKRLENDFKRSQELFATKLVSPEAHDRVRFDLETQKAAFDLARLELSYTQIVAPIDGVISERMVKEGNLIQLHQTLFRIDDFDPLLAVLSVPERELMTLKPQLPVSMSVDALPGVSFAGVVARVSPVVDPATGTFRVTCEFRDDTGSLKTGMFGRLNVIYDQRTNVLSIPREALVDEDGETSVFVVKDKVAKRTPVKIGYASGQSVEIREGLTDGDAVITVGRAAVRDGTKVQVLESAP